MRVKGPAADAFRTAMNRARNDDKTITNAEVTSAFDKLKGSDLSPADQAQLAKDVFKDIADSPIMYHMGHGAASTWKNFIKNAESGFAGQRMDAVGAQVMGMVVKADDSLQFARNKLQSIMPGKGEGLSGADLTKIQAELRDGIEDISQAANVLQGQIDRGKATGTQPADYKALIRDLQSAQSIAIDALGESTPGKGDKVSRADLNQILSDLDSATSGGPRGTTGIEADVLSLFSTGKSTGVESADQQALQELLRGLQD